MRIQFLFYFYILEIPEAHITVYYARQSGLRSLSLVGSMFMALGSLFIFISQSRNITDWFSQRIDAVQF